MTLKILAAGITHRGTVRENNEDCIAIGYWTSQETMEAARQALGDQQARLLAVVVAAHAVGHDAGEGQVEFVIEGARGKRRTLRARRGKSRAGRHGLDLRRPGGA